MRFLQDAGLALHANRRRSIWLMVLKHANIRNSAVGAVWTAGCRENLLAFRIFLRLSGKNPESVGSVGAQDDDVSSSR